MDPLKLNKYLYVTKTPTWLIRTVYGIGVLVWIPVVWASIAEALVQPFFALIFLPIIVILTVHYLASFTLNLFYKQFDLKKHSRLLKEFWSTQAEPSVDVYLPICGEDMQVLRNTWKYVSRLDYSNMTVYVLDDSKDDLEEHRALAKRYGFEYIERPNKGEMKKAGNLKYAYLRTTGDFIAIFDADFSPHPEYLKELIPYMQESKVGIVQSPQYFPTTNEVHKKGPLAYGGARAQEIFYRIIQVARDRLGGAHCCGTCAIYRREALDSIGGFVQIGHSEDAHTGFTLTAQGWIVRYVPLIVSIGLSPDDPHAFFHQQHRWCLGNTMMMLDKKFWNANIPWRIKYCYITGFLFYLHQPLLLLFSFQLFFVLFIYGNSIDILAGLPFYPHIIWAFVFMIFFYIAPLKWGYLYAILLRTYAYCHATLTEILGGTVGWIPTNSKQAGVSLAFRQTVIGVSIYTFLYIVCIAFALRNKSFHVFNYNYYFVEFWIIYNLVLAGVILWHLYRTVERAYAKQITESLSLVKWRIKTLGSYTVGATGVFLLIANLSLPSSNAFNTQTQTVLTTTATVFEAIAQFMPSTKNAIAIPKHEFSFEQDRKFGDEGTDILELQRFLNSHGYVVKTYGIGSSGEESEYFGNYTYNALRKFQRANDMSPTGHLESATRKIINEQLQKERTL